MDHHDNEAAGSDNKGGGDELGLFKEVRELLGPEPSNIQLIDSRDGHSLDFDNPEPCENPECVFTLEITAFEMWLKRFRSDVDMGDLSANNSPWFQFVAEVHPFMNRENQRIIGKLLTIFTMLGPPQFMRFRFHPAPEWVVNFHVRAVEMYGERDHCTPEECLSVVHSLLGESPS